MAFEPNASTGVMGVRPATRVPITARKRISNSERDPRWKARAGSRQVKSRISAVRIIKHSVTGERLPSIVISQLKRWDRASGD